VSGELRTAIAAAPGGDHTCGEHEPVSQAPPCRPRPLAAAPLSCRGADSHASTTIPRASEARRASRRLSAARTSRGGLRRQLSRLNAALAAAGGELQGASRQAQQGAARLRRAQQERDALAEKAAALEARAADGARRLARAEGLVPRLEERCAALGAEKQRLQERAAGLGAQASRLRQQLEAAQRAAEDGAKELEQLRSRWAPGFVA
jgi:chromosome segregation ATPase